MKNLVVLFVIGAVFSGLLCVFLENPNENLAYDFGGDESGNVYYMMHTHHVESLVEPNMARSIINAVRYLAENKASIDVLVFSNVYDRGIAVKDYLDDEPDIEATLTLDDSYLESLTGYDVVFIHSSGHRFPEAIEQGIEDYLSSGGNIIGSHDVIWEQFNNPILEEVFGATARGEGSTPGMGWYHGDFDACKAIDHPITEGLDGCWRLYDEQFYFDIDFKRNITAVMETLWRGEMIPIAWTFSVEPEEPPEIEAEVDCHPDSLNKWSEGNWITCYIELPEGYDPRDIDASTILLNDILRPELNARYGFVASEESYLVDNDGDSIPERMVKFDRQDVQDALHVGGRVELRITGLLRDGTKFEGRDEIRLFEPVGLLGGL